MLTDSKDDFLDEDPRISSQRWALVSVVSPASINAGPDFDWSSTTPNGDPWLFRLLKIRFVCETMEQAEAKKKFLHDIDAYHNIYIMPVGRWGPFEDSEDFAEDVQYKDEQANQIMKSFKEHQTKADEFDTSRRINAKNDADRRRKLMEKRNKKKESDAKHALTETDNILANEIVAENLKSINELSIEELKLKSLELDTIILDETEKKKIRNEKSIEQNNLKKIENERVLEMQRVQRQNAKNDVDDAEDVDDIPMKHEEQVSTTEDMIVRDFVAENQHLIQKKTEDNDKVTKNIETTEEKLKEQRKSILRIDAEKKKIQDKINEIRNRK